MDEIGAARALRWVGAALQEAERGFRRIRGYKDMPKLVAALRAHDAQLDVSAA